MRVVDVDDILPSVVSDDVKNRLVVLGPKAEGVIHQSRRRHRHLCRPSYAVLNEPVTGVSLYFSRLTFSGNQGLKNGMWYVLV